MTDFELLLLGIVLILLVVQVVLGAFLYKFYRLLDARGRLSAVEPGAVPASGHLPAGPETLGMPPGAVTASAPRGDIDVLRGSADISESMRRIGEKYGAISVTLASRDGLAIASSAGEADEEAATMSHAYFRGAPPEDPAVRLFGLEFRGEPVIAILRTGKPVPDAWEDSIREDLLALMAWWL
ncbi:MAG: hypothetical protein GKC04_09185 [Methanomicrobiales archaeon]|nr:hypothetical protein [Methanomicrobiales archaeon]